MKLDFIKTIKKEHVLLVVYSVVIIAGLAKVQTNESVPAFSMSTEKKIVMIDAGHGGWAPCRL